ncbi:MAG TPA: M48 family peptidase [Candidatus Angelobacter sp.]|nr:M48 family peptidase [Candidatus Angelobacter sp.]
MNPRLANIFKRAYSEVRPQAPLPDFDVRFFAFANLNNTIRLRQGRILVRLSDLLEAAPEPVLHAILHILLSKLYRQEIDAAQAALYRRYTGSHAVSAKTHLIRQMRGRKRIESSQGQHYHLEEIFDELNTRFFHGLMARPLMTWSKNRSRQSLGHYDPAHNTIVVSRIFDRPTVPRYAVEYLVFHEMLHLRHPVKLRGSRRCVHPRSFQDEEKLFPHLEDAKKYLKNM